MLDVVVLSLTEEGTDGCGGCGGSDTHGDGGGGSDTHGDGCGGSDTHGDGGGCGGQTRAAVRHCVDVLTAAGASVTLVTATSDADIDAVLARLDAPARADGLCWPAGGAGEPPRLVVAATGDAQLRAVVRRMVRRYAPPPSRRPDDLRADRTVPDLPAVAILPLAPPDPTDLVYRLGLPTRPDQVAAALLSGRVRRLDLLRTDAGSVTLHGALIGGATADGAPVPWHGTVQVDDKALCRPDQAVIACAVANADGYTTIDGLPLTRDTDPADGAIDVAVVLAVSRRVGLRRRAALEVRRTRGRAVAVTPRGEVPYVDDGVSATLPRTRSWWVERDAWGVFTS